MPLQRFRRSPLPREFWLIVLIMWSEPLCATVIDPFVNAYVRETGITGGDDTKTGYYGGVIESVFYIGEAISVVFWARLSDRLGRRPILLTGLLGLSVSMFSFGSSPAFWILVASRFLQGSFNGTLGIVKTVLNEVTNESNRASAFRAVPLTWTMGATLGPFLGGVLSRPAQRFPNLFSRLEFFQENPYFLPCAATGVVTLAVWVLNLVALRETSPLVGGYITYKTDLGDSPSDESSDEHFAVPDECTSLHDHISTSSTYASTSTPSSKSSPSPLPQILKNRTLIILLASYALFSFLDQSHQVLFTLFASTSPTVFNDRVDNKYNGGLGFTPYNIGLTLSCFELLNVMSIWFIFPWLMECPSIGPKRVYRVGMVIIGGVWPCYAILSYRGSLGLADGTGSGDQALGGLGWRVWVVIFLQYVCASVGLTCYGAMQIVLASNSSITTLATVNALAQMLQSLSRAIAPLVSNSLFALSMRLSQISGGMGGMMLVWGVLGGLAVVSAGVAVGIPRDVDEER